MTDAAHELRVPRVISKVLVANRGEIAIRAFRAAYELGIGTVAVYAYEDRNSPHRLKADESYQIGEAGHPVRAYLSVDEIVETARRRGRRRRLPGLRVPVGEPGLAAACAAAGITFVGPGAQVLELTGNKSRAIAAAREAGLPVLSSSAPSASVDELVSAAPTSVSRCSSRRSPAAAAVGCAASATRGAARSDRSRQPRGRVGVRRRTVYLEQAVLNPRHIEVQILADTRRRHPPLRA